MSSETGIEKLLHQDSFNYENMMYKNKLFFVLFLLMGYWLNAQENRLKKAEKAYDNFAYSSAIASYESLVDQGLSSEEIYKNLGNANYLIANYQEAENWYSKLIELNQTDIDPEYLYKYAQCLKSLEKYEASDMWMQKFNAAKRNDLRGTKFKENIDYLKKIREQSGRYRIANISINSMESDFSPSFFGEDVMVFSSARDTGLTVNNIHVWNKRPFLNLYATEVIGVDKYSEPIKFSKKLNKKTHESSPIFSRDGNTVYFTRNNSNNGNFARDKEGVSRLKIFRATLKDGEWTGLKALPFNSDEYSIAHPALSPDGKKLYFASDMPGTIGASDIFVVDILPDGKFGTPQNLGNKINTEGSETFPFVTDDNVLYFASNGHPGLGGLDIFATKINNLEEVYIVNAGEPVNSNEDDFSFILRDRTHKGYFASNRHGGKGDDDIYSFIEETPIDLTCNILVEGTVRDKETGEPLENAKISITNFENEAIGEVMSGNDGTFLLEGECKEGDYKLLAVKEEYENGSEVYKVVRAKNVSGLELVLEKTVKQAAVGDDLIAFLGLKPVYFDLDKSDILPAAEETMAEVIAYMNFFPDLKVQIQSHTDAKASDAYNNQLSERRAQATLAYLTEKGIAEDRVSGKGFGETKLVNDCTTRESCPDEKHQMNRRSEFIVVE